jgi:superfamily II DNA or RNA helicase
MTEPPETAAFVDPEHLLEAGPSGFVRNLERLLQHLGYEGVLNVDGPGDKGADIYATRNDEQWIIQAKWKQSSSVGKDAVTEVSRAMLFYGANRGAVVTNRDFTSGAKFEQERVEGLGQQVTLWPGEALVDLSKDSDFFRKSLSAPDHRPYQVEAFGALRHDLGSRGRALLVLATGLGKTVVAGEVLAWFLRENPDVQVLLLANRIDLVHQLERAIWRHLDPSVRTQVLHGQERPNALTGVTLATVQSAVSYVESGYRPGLVIVDEAHNVTPDGDYAKLLDLTTDALQLGVTATPWRADGYNIEARFGEASYKMGIADGIKMGYLADVDYRLFLDTVNWEEVRSLSSNNYSIRELNTKLFMPQIDENIRDHLLEVWNTTINPRAIVFCQTIEHAERMKEFLRGVGDWALTETVHANLTKRDRRLNLLKFRNGDIPLLTAVDILNEGVDIPDVNILCFARVTHSRKVFVQQLGRGVRLNPAKNKEKVTVLDFVTDIRRLKAVTDLDAAFETGHDTEVLHVPGPGNVTFIEHPEVGGFLRRWIEDVANLDSERDQARLDFPSI